AAVSASASYWAPRRRWCSPSPSSLPEMPRWREGTPPQPRTHDADVRKVWYFRGHFIVVGCERWRQDRVGGPGGAGAMQYRFGEYALDTDRCDLCRTATRIKLRPKVFDVLCYLIAHHDRVIARQELLESLWPQQFIGEATLNSCIMEARQ